MEAESSASSGGQWLLGPARSIRAPHACRDLLSIIPRRRNGEAAFEYQSRQPKPADHGGSLLRSRSGSFLTTFAAPWKDRGLLRVDAMRLTFTAPCRKSSCCRFAPSRARSSLEHPG